MVAVAVAWALVLVDVVAWVTCDSVLTSLWLLLVDEVDCSLLTTWVCWILLATYELLSVTVSAFAGVAKNVNPAAKVTIPATSQFFPLL